MHQSPSDETPNSRENPSSDTSIVVEPPKRWPVGEGGTRPRIAVLIVHGMGEQAPLDTLSGTIDGLRRAIHKATGAASELVLQGHYRARALTADQGGGAFVGCELRIPNDPRILGELHLHESYWAPMTAGLVRLGDVVAFLFRTGIRGLWKTLHPFRRFIFGSVQKYRVPAWSAVHLLGALLVVGSLVALNAVVGWAQARRIIQRGLPSEAFDLLTGILFIVLLALLLTTLALWLAHRKGSQSPLRLAPLVLLPAAVLVLVLGSATALLVAYAGGCSKEAPRLAFCASALRSELASGPWNLFLAGTLGFASLAVVLTAISWLLAQVDTMFGANTRAPEQARQTTSYSYTRYLSFTTLLAIVLGLGFLAAQSRHTSPKEVVVAQLMPGWSAMVLWGIMIVLGLAIRGVFIQYLGDVLVYVASHRLDRFHEARDRIRARVYQDLRQLYLLRTQTQWAYDHVIVMGHSLGSLAAYDALNRLIAEDGALSLDIVKRTPLFLTFGSPLDKTAFLFAQQVTEDTETRVRLATLKQPMLIEQALRPRWINIWSPWDIVSGPLEYYDPPSPKHGAAPASVLNEVDPKATTLLWAHTEYWKQDRIYLGLLDTIVGLVRAAHDPPLLDEADPQSRTSDPMPASVLGAERWNHTGIRVIAGQKYRVSASGQWTDLQITSGPQGFPTAKAPWYSRWILHLAERSRRVPSANWFALIVAVEEDASTACNIFENRADLVRGALWVAPVTGELCCFANDHHRAYWNNSGSIQLTVSCVSQTQDAPEDVRAS